MKKLIPVLSLMAILMLSSFSKRNDEKCIYWHERNTVTWNDFREVKKGKLKYEAARINVGIESNMSLQDNILKFTIKTCANPDKSYVEKGKKTDHILNHEQGHFDIQEIYSRKLRKELMEHKFKLENIGDNYNSIYRNIFKECAQEQAKYDKETQHSINEEKQAEWDVKIKEELNSLKKYSFTDLVKEIKIS